MRGGPPHAGKPGPRDAADAAAEPGSVGDGTGSDGTGAAQPVAEEAGDEQARAKRKRAERFSEPPDGAAALASVRAQRSEYAAAAQAERERRRRPKDTGVQAEATAADSTPEQAEARPRRVRFAPTTSYDVREVDVSDRRPLFTTVQQVSEWLANAGGEVYLVAFEFSGALSMRLMSEGKVVLTCDTRRGEGYAPHYRGPVQDIVSLTVWHIAFFVGPPCFQQMRRDDYLPQKIADGRAWWGVALVWWCVCCTSAKAVVVEQPDTIAHDFLDVRELDGVHLAQVRTAELGDAPDKYMRFTLRGVTVDLSPPTAELLEEAKAEAPKSKRRSQFNYVNAEERDKARSSWASFHELCGRLSHAEFCEPPTAPPTYPGLDGVVEAVAVAWWRAGNPLPADYHRADARPERSEDREYQTVRGEGDGAPVAGVVPLSLRTKKTAAHPEQREGNGSDDETTDDESGDESSGGEGDEPPVKRVEQLAEGDVAVVAVEVGGVEARVLSPADGEVIHVLPHGQAMQPGVVEASEKLVSRWLSRGSRVFGYLAGVASDRARMVVVAVEQAMCLEATPHTHATRVQTTCGDATPDAHEKPREDAWKAGTSPTPTNEATQEAKATAPPTATADGHGRPVRDWHCDRLSNAAEDASREPCMTAVSVEKAEEPSDAPGRGAWPPGRGEPKTEGDSRSMSRSARATAERRGRRRGAAARWCALAAVGVTPFSRYAELAVLSAAHYTTHGAGTTEMLLAEGAAREALQLTPGRGNMMAPARPVLAQGEGITPRDLIASSQRGLMALKERLSNHGGENAAYFATWSDSVAPLDLSDAPTELLDQPLQLSDPTLGETLFSEPLPVYELPWLERMPEQSWRAREGCEAYAPQNVMDLVDSEARRQMAEWFEAAVLDLQCLEEHGPECDRRHKPGTLAIGQDQFHVCARGYVWDCRQRDGCQLLNYGGEFSTDFNLDYLREKLEGYPDQRLASNILEGVRLEADLELQIVLSPNLVSIGEGYESVQKTVRELRSEGFYKFFSSLPFAPIFVVSQGSRIKKLGVKKYRRTSNFSGPHKLVIDQGGVAVIPINTASKCYTVPAWLAHTHDADLRRWLHKRYEHVPSRPSGAPGLPCGTRPAPHDEVESEVEEPMECDVDTDLEREGEAVHGSGGAHGGHQLPDRTGVSPRYKFPKEHKPMLPDVMVDTTLLAQAAIELDEPIYAFVEDAAFYFNQLGYAPEELWKSNLIVGARAGDLDSDRREFDPGGLLFVSEERLGFGSYASSNIAQRFSNAVVGWVLDEFDRLEEEALARATAEGGERAQRWLEWVARRRPLEATCRRHRPKRKGVALSDCTQTRLGTLRMYTDDPVGIVVGTERAVRLIEAWRIVTSSINLQMAGAEKRQIGAHVEWIGILLLVGIGVVVVPRNKLIRARDALERARLGHSTFQEWRALVGLLEHLRFIARLTADATASLYRPHGAHGESQGGPSTLVIPDELMMAKLTEWAAIIMSCAGALVTLGLVTDAGSTFRGARAIFAASADAAGDGEGTPGFGGYAHGFYWRVALPAEVLRLMHITAWETLATAVNILVAARLAGDECVLSLRGDAALIAHVISKEKSNSKDVQEILHHLRRSPRYRHDISRRLVLQHISGEGNVPSDAVSRGLWRKLALICEVLMVRPVAVALNAAERSLVEAVVKAAARRRNIQLAADAIRRLFDAHEHSRALNATMLRDARDEPPTASRSGAPASRKRARTDAERHTGKAEKSCTDGDGPTLPFRPYWAKRERDAADATGSANHLAEGTAGTGTSQGFRPHWAKRRQTPPGPPEGGSAAPVTHTALNTHTAPDASELYSRPAYGQSIMRADQREAAERLARRLQLDRTAGRIDAEPDVLREMAMAVQEARADGLNPRTASKDALALREWEFFAHLRGFDPNLRSEWTKRFPERESLKFSSFLLFCAQRMKGRARGQRFAKPMSVYQRYLALRRVFRQRSVDIPSSAQVREALRGLIKRWVRRKGIESLRPRRVEPVTPPMIARVVEQARGGTLRIKSTAWALSNWTCFIVVAWMVINLQIGSRKGESTRLPGDVDSNDWLTRRSLTWQVDGKILVDPDPKELQSKIKAGRDLARIAPKGAKCDAFGTCHGTEPIVLPYQNNDINPAAWCLQIELRRPCRGAQRDTLPLFCDAKGDVFTDAAFASWIMAALRAAVGDARAQHLSPHSWRVWLATALRSKGASDGLIMAFGRWLNPESVKIYARLGVAEYAEWMNKIMTVKSVDSTRTTNLLDEHDIGEWDAVLPERETHAERDIFDAAAAEAPAATAKLDKGTRVAVYWTEMNAWYDGTVTSTRKEHGDDSRPQLATRVMYDAVGSWPALPYWHCLDDECWRLE